MVYAFIVKQLQEVSVESVDGKLSERKRRPECDKFNLKFLVSVL